MTDQPADRARAFMQQLVERTPGEGEFHQAVAEVLHSVLPLFAEHPEYDAAGLLERLVEPDRVITFRVAWTDDRGHVQVNRGYRVQFNNAIGPYKGGLRFHPSVRLGVIKFLGFEQIFKNSLTGLPMGGGKGGSDFNPRGRSDAEVMRFCQAFMSELYRHIGKDSDVPAGDIGVGAREVGYLFGQYKRLHGRWEPALTGKGLAYGGSLIRKEATGYGCVYFVREMLARHQETVQGLTCVVSGSGNVALHTAEKLIQMGAKVVTLSDSDGYIHDPDGLDENKLAWATELKVGRRGRIREFAEQFRCAYYAGQRPWAVPAQLAFPCATQNEIQVQDAMTLVKGGLRALGEGANMPATAEAVDVLQAARVLYGPGKAANAGGVAVSGLEQSQNSQRLSWTREEVDARLQDIMSSIHATCVRHGTRADGSVDYVKGANVGGFTRVAEAMVAQGVY